MQDNMTDIQAQWDHYASTARADDAGILLDVGCHHGDAERYLVGRPGFHGRLGDCSRTSVRRVRRMVGPGLIAYLLIPL